MKAEAFENVKNQIGFCGIWCGSCAVGNGVLRELTRRYAQIIQMYGLEDWAAKDFDFRDFARGLASIQAMPLCLGCLNGDGRPNCEIRACALNENVSDCSECGQLTECKNSETLEKMRTGACQADLCVKIENVDRQRLIEKWTIDLKGRWPWCIIFCTSARDSKPET